MQNPSNKNSNLLYLTLLAMRDLDVNSDCYHPRLVRFALIYSHV